MATELFDRIATTHEEEMYSCRGSAKATLPQPAQTSSNYPLALCSPPTQSTVTHHLRATCPTHKKIMTPSQNYFSNEVNSSSGYSSLNVFARSRTNAPRVATAGLIFFLTIHACSRFHSCASTGQPSFFVHSP